MSYMNQPGIILLREGTDTSQGKAQLISNINACQVSPYVTLFVICRVAAPAGRGSSEQCFTKIALVFMVQSRLFAVVVLNPLNEQRDCVWY